MNFFENTRKPQGFGGKLMTKMMNIGHAKLSQRLLTNRPLTKNSWRPRVPWPFRGRVT